MTMKGRSQDSSAAIRRLFEIIEKRYGGLPFDTGAAAEVIVADALKRSHLERLFRHEATALHIKEFFPRQAASELGTALAKEANSGKARNWKISTSRGLESSDVLTLGEHPPFNIATSQGKVDEYFEKVVPEINYRRHDPANGTPYLYPLDLLRLQLDESFPAGAGLAREEGGERRPRSAGLPRVMKGPTRWKRGFIHVDEMGPLKQNDGFFSANIYLQLPTEYTGETPLPVLNVWPVGIRSKWDWYRNALLLSGLSSQDPEDQLRLRRELGEPKEIAVEPGDLVMLCVQRPHEAIGFKDGTRVSLQSFIQFSGMDKRLLIEN